MMTAHVVNNGGGNGRVEGAPRRNVVRQGHAPAGWLFSWYDADCAADDATPARRYVSVGGSPTVRNRIGILTRAGELGWTRESYETDAAERSVRRSLDQDTVSSGCDDGGVWAYGIISSQCKTND
jgi:hypothetical protein